MTTAAAIDRLVHHSVVLELNVPSYRLEHAKHRPKAAATSDAAGDPDPLPDGGRDAVPAPAVPA